MRGISEVSRTDATRENKVAVIPRGIIFNSHRYPVVSLRLTTG